MGRWASETSFDIYIYIYIFGRRYGSTSIIITVTHGSSPSNDVMQAIFGGSNDFLITRLLQWRMSFNSLVPDSALFRRLLFSDLPAEWQAGRSRELVEIVARDHGVPHCVESLFLRGIPASFYTRILSVQPGPDGRPHGSEALITRSG